MTKGILPALALLVGLSGCATLTPEKKALMFQPIDMALTHPTETLEAEARAGQSRAQYALSLVSRYGLRGEAPDRPTADAWRRKALAPRGSTPVTTYLAGVGGRQGRVFSVNLPTYDLSFADDSILANCAGRLATAALEANEAGSRAEAACGGGVIFSRLRTAWIAATDGGALKP